jgi:hypothetical protein
VNFETSLGDKLDFSLKEMMKLVFHAGKKNNISLGPYMVLADGVTKI